MLKSRGRALSLWAAGCVGVVIGLGAGPAAGRLMPDIRAQAPAAKAPPAPAPVTNTPRVFKAPAGLILSEVKPAETAAFETAIARLRDALAASHDPTVQRQAAGWRFFKAEEPGPGGSVLYVSVVDPTVPQADYTVSRFLTAAYPGNDALLSDYADAFAGDETLLNLDPIEPPKARP